MRARAKRSGFDTSAMIFSTVFHGSLLAAAWTSTQYKPEPMTFITYEVELVSPPPAAQADEVTPAVEELVVERPDPEPTPPEPEVEEVVPVERPDDPEPAPEPPPRREEPKPDPPDPAEKPVVAAAPEPAPEKKPEVSGEGINVRIEGLKRDYPEYYNNIIRQIQRCFRWRDGGSWQTTVLFWIRPDGGAADIEFERRSGNSSFDFEAMGAIDCAGRGRFGPLPADLPYERLPIRFEFRPSGDDRSSVPGLGLPTMELNRR